MSKKRRRRRTLPPDQATDPNPSTAPTLPSAPNSIAQTESGSEEGNDQDEPVSKLLPHKKGRSKGSRGNTPPWRLEQLREAGRARGKQLKADLQHQSQAGKARAARGDMGEIAKKGNARANQKDPEHQSKARRGKRGKHKPKSQDNGGGGQGQATNSNSPQTEGEEYQEK